MAVKVSCGNPPQDYDVAGKTVGQVENELKEALNIPKKPLRMVDGKKVRPKHVLLDGQQLEFVKPSGENG